jgi:Protein of unknown function (DUF2950)
MSRTIGKASRMAEFILFSLIITMIIMVVACSNKQSATAPTIATFASPDAAGTALLAAAKSGDENAVLAIFGPESKAVVFSGDSVQDKATLETFASAYGVMHRWRRMPDDGQVLLIGADNFSFPIPLRKNGSGQWFFDTVAGKDEILSRRIGRNELAVIEVCAALADAQDEYFSQPRGENNGKQYALKFISDTGKQNGLYWESADGQPKSPLGPLAAFATDEGYSVKADSHVPFHGYNFKMLKGQGSHAQGGAREYVVDGKMTGGFAFVAYPAEYLNSGVMTFILNQDGILFQKDLGKTTTETATAMTEFDPSDGWTPVEE